MITEKILIDNHHSGLGDIIHMIPMINNLKKNYIKNNISVIAASKSHADLLKSTGLVDKFYYFNPDRMTNIQILNFVMKIRKEKFNIGFLTVNANKKLGLAFLFLLGCKIKVIEYDRKFIYRHNILQAREEKESHRVIRNLNLLMPLKVKINDDKPFLKIDNTTMITMQNKIKIFDANKKIGVCVGTDFSKKKTGLIKKEFFNIKQWSMENFIELINRFIQYDFNVILIGGKKEESEIRAHITMLKNTPRLVNFINKATIMESAALAKQCELVIGCDTGMMHIADALGVKTLTLFGPTNPELCGAYTDIAEHLTLNLDCQYCYGTDKSFKCVHRKCINNITVEKVYNKALEIISKA